MTKIYRQITDLIGHTPLVELSKYSKFRGVETPVGCHDYRADEWQHGCRVGFGGSRERLPTHPHDARNDEH